MLIRGWDVSNPVLLFLHGGPGAPLFTYAREIGVRAQLEKYFVMVYWEQRGTGKSYSPFIPEESMTLEQFVSDTYELTQILRHRFDVPKIFLVGRSWGSIVGILTAKRYPELYHAYVGIGQIVNPLEGDSISYRLTLQTAKSLGNEEALTDLERIGSPPYDHRELIIQRKWLTKFNDFFLARKLGENVRKTSSRTKLLSTPEYSLIDIVKMGMDPFFSIKHLWDDEFYEIDLLEEVPRLEIPVYFLVGQYDYFAPPELVERFYNNLTAPMGKDRLRFEASGHEPELEEPEKFNRIMVTEILGTLSRK